jgi:Ca-activated chloride channel family protein
MEIDLQALHFIRPWWLLLCLPALGLACYWWRQQRSEQRLSAVIAPHLLKHLLIHPQTPPRLRPAYLLSALLVIGAIATAGPTWEQERPAFMENRAPLILAVDLSPSMDATDIPPSRLSAVKHQLQDLVQRRAGARTGLLVYAGSAHWVLPPSDDPALLDSFIQALSTDLLDSPGKNVLAVTQQALQLLAQAREPATLVLFTDGAERQQLPALSSLLAESQAPLQLLIVAVGQQSTGVLLQANGQPRLDRDAKVLSGSFGRDELQALASASHAPIASLSQNDDILDWIELHAEQHLVAASSPEAEVHWRDAGYWLSWLLLPLAWLSLRRGWRVNWLALLLLSGGLVLPAQPARAGMLADAFFSADQQGRWAFEQGRYLEAAGHFSDPYWQGLAAYQGADFSVALASFQRLAAVAGPQQADAWLYVGNCQARLHQYPQALAAYSQALALQPGLTQAQANHALVSQLQRQFEEDQQVAPEDDEGQQQYDEQGKGDSKNAKVRINGPRALSAELWLRNLNTSPAGFLKQKFKLQQARHNANPQVAP